MTKFKLNFAAVEEGLAGPTSVSAGESTENSEDESEIIGDQDQTEDGVLSADGDEAMGGMGTGEYGLPGPKFAQGDIDVVDQMARTTRVADKAAHREEDAFPGFDTATEADAADEDESDDESATTH